MKMKNLILFFSFSFFLVNYGSGQDTLNFTEGTALIDYGTRTIVGDFNSNSSFNKLSLYINLSHGWVNDLELNITNPAGTKTSVFKRLGTGDCFGCDGANMDIIFFDGAQIDYDSLNKTCNNEPAYSGSARAMESLDLLLETDPNGTWTVEVIDHFPDETGFITDLVLEFSSYLAPECSLELFPENGENDVSVNTEIEWQAVANASGYYLNLGYKSSAYNIYDKLDVGKVLSYDPGLLLCGQDYYFQVIPYNDFGEASGCVEHYFNTEYLEAYSAGDVEICKGSTADLSVTAGYNYVWSPELFLSDPYDSDPVFSGDSSITYTVIVTNENGCMDTLNVGVLVNSVGLNIDSVDHVRLNSLGFIDISMDDPEGEYFFEWKGPNGYYSNAEDPDSLEIGCYDLSVMDLKTGCTLDTTICVDDLTGVGREFSTTVFKVYPNPFKDEIMIYQESTQTKRFVVSLFDIYGRELALNNWSFKDSKMHISTSGLPAGTYLLKILTEINSFPLFIQVIKQE